MTTKFESIDEAKIYLSKIFYFDPSKIEEDSNLKVSGMDFFLLESEDIPEEVKKSIIEQFDAQKGFRVQASVGEILFVIGPFRDGFDCWVINPETGLSVRV
jgi:hypothetical protein